MGSMIFVLFSLRLEGGRDFWSWNGVKVLVVFCRATGSTESFKCPIATARIVVSYQMGNDKVYLFTISFCMMMTVHFLPATHSF